MQSDFRKRFESEKRKQSDDERSARKKKEAEDLAKQELREYIMAFARKNIGPLGFTCEPRSSGPQGIAIDYQREWGIAGIPLLSLYPLDGNRFTASADASDSIKDLAGTYNKSNLPDLLADFCGRMDSSRRRSLKEVEERQREADRERRKEWWGNNWGWVTALAVILLIALTV